MARFRVNPQTNCAPNLGAARAAFQPLGLTNKIKRGPTLAKKKKKETFTGKIAGSPRMGGWR